ncbi:prohibitin family protein [Leptospira langatensis]|uniref:Prohibitin family protein n=1 Tax=Leptospira langatensis TaxID=2484983 RepID=A0A5F1ZVN8_9LEPT|nr:SPFH domain-containing protein [Leptospira langatensis]TGK01224.1 prohibitin family protein [Leptospira langatensis]TGL42326.1 prohibitin family protein [Leptospira langatensis]
MNRFHFFSLKFSCLAVLLLGFIASTGCYTNIRPGEAGLRYHPLTSGLQRDLLTNALYFYAPWNDIILYPTQWTSYKEKVDVLTRDDLTINVVAAVILRPVPSEIYNLQIEIGPDYYDKVVRPQFRTSVRNALSAYSMIRISKETPKVSSDIRQALGDKLRGKHIEIDDVIIDDIEYSRPILTAIEGKLTKEQEQEQMKFEINIAKKDAEITVIHAEAKAKSTAIEAEGNAQAIVIEAQAKAKAQKLIAAQLTKQYLQLKAFENPNTKLLLVPTGKDALPMIFNMPDSGRIPTAPVDTTPQP